MLFGAPLMLLGNSTSWPHYMSNAEPSVASLDTRWLGTVIALWYAPLIGVTGPLVDSDLAIRGTCRPRDKTPAEPLTAQPHRLG